ncbi:hypothetical protein WN55_08902 [Dufourea novaeangliae]|uniref:Uncharacterized protein n=1 Tax=Dufourea novaeangliae TaxID=178035 RepID=A0A154P746_DUFNO|nr:hypothetical protein WN55_08902 [Dufourea novaeangliae]
MDNPELCDRDSLRYDEACLRLRNEDENLNLWLYWLSSDCAAVSCPRKFFYCLRHFLNFPSAFYPTKDGPSVEDGTR